MNVGIKLLFHIRQKSCHRQAVSQSVFLLPAKSISYIHLLIQLLLLNLIFDFMKWHFMLWHFFICCRIIYFFFLNVYQRQRQWGLQFLDILRLRLEWPFGSQQIWSDSIRLIFVLLKKTHYDLYFYYLPHICCNYCTKKCRHDLTKCLVDERKKKLISNNDIIMTEIKLNVGFMTVLH